MELALEAAALHRLLWVVLIFLAGTVAAIVALVASGRVASPPMIELRSLRGAARPAVPRAR